MKYFILVCLIIGSLCCLPANANKTVSEIFNIKHRKGPMHYLLTTFLTKCNLHLRRIMIYDDFLTEQTFSALTVVQPHISVVLFSSGHAAMRLRRLQFDDLKFDSVILVIDANTAGLTFKNFFLTWRYNRDFILYVFPIPLVDCIKYKHIFAFSMRAYFQKVYCICWNKNHRFHVYTHDPYGDTNPVNWKKIEQYIYWGKNWTHYERSYNKEKKELCSGFDFERTDPTKQEFVVIGIPNNYIHTKVVSERLYDEEIENHLSYSRLEQINNLKKMLNIRFHYYVIPESKGELGIQRAYDFSGVDAILFKKIVMSLHSFWNFFYPTTFESIVIVSHNRGFMTPLEKIIKFYGMWTLSSLIIILSITFIVIRQSTKKVSLAAFDIIRLLTTIGITVPINTRALKIFFSMIFLYFLIIHATFSGHLAEFLTKLEYRKNIDTIEELADPKIKKIYRFGYQIDKNDKLSFLEEKSIGITTLRQCKQIIREPHSTCIAPLSTIHASFFDVETNNSLHISKNTLGLSLISSYLRPGFPLEDKLNRALIFFFEIGLRDVKKMEIQQIVSKNIHKFHALSNVRRRTITINDITFALIFLITGHCAGFVCFLVEILFKNICEKFKH